MGGIPDAGLAARVRSGDRRALARAITLVESSREDHRLLAEQLLQELLPVTGGAIRLGISGSPGVGKSTFIEAFGMHAANAGRRVAVLSVDPSSSLTGGSILGDKTRMEQLARHPQAFIRPSPAAGTLGGVARRSREALLLTEAAGYDLVIVETVGVGQSETAVADMTDMFVLLLPPGGGDELQGIKRGIMELADLILINKADGKMLTAARQTVAEYANALRLLKPRNAHWRASVALCSALTGDGIAAVWAEVERYWAKLGDAGDIAARRAEQASAWLWDECVASLIAALKENPEVRNRLPQLERAVAAGTLPAPLAARQLMVLFTGQCES